MPPGLAATWRASPPARGSSHSAGTSPSASLTVGSGRAEVNSRSPAAVNSAAVSPLADRVSRYGSPSSGIAHSAVPYDLPSGLRDWTAETSREPSGASFSERTRGMAT